MYTEFIVGNKTYKLKLTTRQTVLLEKNLGCNPISIFGNGDRIPTVTEMVQILHSSLQALEHGISITDAYSIFDEWLEEGNTITDFIAVILDIYRASGIIKQEQDTEKN